MAYIEQKTQLIWSEKQHDTQHVAQTGKIKLRMNANNKVDETLRMNAMVIEKMKFICLI